MQIISLTEENIEKHSLVLRLGIPLDFLETMIEADKAKNRCRLIYLDDEDIVHAIRYHEEVTHIIRLNDGRVVCHDPLARDDYVKIATHTGPGTTCPDCMLIVNGWWGVL